MNSRLVDSIAQIVLAMSVEERQYFDRLIAESQSSIEEPSLAPSQSVGLYEDSGIRNKDAQVARVVKQMQEFEEKHAMPLVPLSNEQWNV